ncbi:hypothetical protein NPX13_g5769 [Xylaria arbuscula]|uniref:Uncharacterized protein n=1 Tax=Xylaria arbuscula TaxID=114810 RepID=A0A9W8ND40_9PEZI|nr:hypothetical protein NPX13_g5769 [Xylaria arbuscula]
MTYEWVIPADQIAGTDIKYFFRVMNATNHAEDPSVTASSQPFLILPAVANLSLSSTFSTSSITMPPAITAITTSPAAAAISTSNHGLTTGEKIKVSVSVPIGSIVLAFIGLRAWRRHLRVGPKQHNGRWGDTSPEKYTAEIGGSGVVKADGGNPVHRPELSQKATLDAQSYPR